MYNIKHYKLDQLANDMAKLDLKIKRNRANLKMAESQLKTAISPIAKHTLKKQVLLIKLNILDIQEDLRLLWLEIEDARKNG